MDMTWYLKELIRTKNKKREYIFSFLFCWTKTIFGMTEERIYTIIIFGEKYKAKGVKLQNEHLRHIE